MMLLLMILLGGFLSRWHGGGFFKAPDLVKNLAWAVTPAVFVFMAYLDAQMPVAACFAAAVCLAGCSLGIATGNAPFRDLATFKGERRRVKLLFIVEPLYGRLPEYWVDALGLSVIGLASVIGFTISVAWISLPAAGIVALGGLLKGAAYMIGWRVFPKNENGIATATGEWLSGAIAYAALGLAVSF